MFAVVFCCLTSVSLTRMIAQQPYADQELVHKVASVTLS
jgi:hypothetical protein